MVASDGTDWGFRRRPITTELTGRRCRSRHCEERLRRSNPGAATCAASATQTVVLQPLDCFASLAMTDRELAHLFLRVALVISHRNPCRRAERKSTGSGVNLSDVVIEGDDILGEELTSRPNERSPLERGCGVEGAKRTAGLGAVHVQIAFDSCACSSQEILTSVF